MAKIITGSKIKKMWERTKETWYSVNKDWLRRRPYAWLYSEGIIHEGPGSYWQQGNQSGIRLYPQLPASPEHRNFFPLNSIALLPGSWLASDWWDSKSLLWWTTLLDGINNAIHEWPLSLGFSILNEANSDAPCSWKLSDLTCLMGGSQDLELRKEE